MRDESSGSTEIEASEHQKQGTTVSDTDHATRCANVTIITILPPCLPLEPVLLFLTLLEDDVLDDILSRDLDDIGSGIALVDGLSATLRAERGTIAVRVVRRMLLRGTAAVELADRRVSRAGTTAAAATNAATASTTLSGVGVLLAVRHAGRVLGRLLTREAASRKRLLVGGGRSGGGLLLLRAAGHLRGAVLVVQKSEDVVAGHAEERRKGEWERRWSR